MGYLLIETEMFLSPLSRELPEPGGGGGQRPQSHEPRGALQAYDVGAQRAGLLRGAAATPLPAGQQHGPAQSRLVATQQPLCV